jgi:hypothetical protein
MTLPRTVVRKNPSAMPLHLSFSDGGEKIAGLGFHKKLCPRRRFAAIREFSSRRKATHRREEAT